MTNHTFSEYWEHKRSHLCDDYRDDSGSYSESCSLIAFDIYELLSSDGLVPDILQIKGKVVDEAGNMRTLSPLPYEGRVVWGAHIVCALDGVVYDPVLETPLELDDYISQMFNANVAVTNVKASY